MASTSNYAANPNIGSANIVAALGGTRAVPASASVLITAAISSTLINRAIIQNNKGSSATAPNANVARFYLHDGTTFYLIKEFAFTPVNATTEGVASPEFEVAFNDLVLPTGWTLRAGISVRADIWDNTNIAVLGANF